MFVFGVSVGCHLVQIPLSSVAGCSVAGSFRYKYVFIFHTYYLSLCNAAILLTTPLHKTALY